jgi:TraG P-loop domain
LEVWLRDGPYGPIVDGVTNIRLDRKIVHFELSKIKESEQELLSVAGFLITNDVRNYIMTMRRGARKRLILEELSAFLALENGPKIVRDYYERMRKYNCWVLSILQNFGRLHEQNEGVTGAILSNTDQVFLLKSNSKKDLDLVSETYPIPETTKNTVLKFPQPSGYGPEVYSGFALVQVQEGRPKVTIGRNYAHDEMLYLSSSTGSVFEERSRQLRTEKNIVDAIIKYSKDFGKRNGEEQKPKEGGEQS